MDKKVYIKTLGCQMNKSDTERILGMLELLGYREVKEPKEADFLIVNTCNIRQQAADRAFSNLGLWGKWKRKKNPNLKIAVCGCVAQQDKELIRKRAPYVDLVFGTLNIPELPSLIKKIEEEEKVVSIHKTPINRTEECTNVKRVEGLTAWLPIIDGCDYFCTYCVVPYVRGRQRSRLPEDIIKEAHEIAKQGYKEIVLLGQTVDSYGRDIDDENVTLANLLREINKIEGIVRIRFVTSYPTDITDDLIQTVKELDKVCEYFHIPMQSGSDEVLKAMKRQYTRAEYIDICNKIRSQIPNVAITSDFIAGFPGETEEQFKESLTIFDEVGIDYANTAAYSPRKQTPAATWRSKYLSEEVKQERLSILNAKVREATRKSNELYVGKVLDVLVQDYEEVDGETVLRGYTRNNKVTHFKGDTSLVGELVDVKITEALLWCLKGEIVE